MYVVGFAKAVKWHNSAAMILTLNYIIFVTGNLFTKNGRYYRIEKEEFLARSDETAEVLFLWHVQR